jgi:hypothetical protein
MLSNVGAVLRIWRMTQSFGAAEHSRVQRATACCALLAQAEESVVLVQQDGCGGGSG